MSEELIDDTHDDSRGRRRSDGDPRRRMLNDLISSPLIKSDISGSCGLSIHLTPTKRKRKDLTGKFLSNELQGKCNMCTYKTTWCCSKCKDDDDLETLMFCVIQNLRECALLYIS